MRKEDRRPGVSTFMTVEKRPAGRRKMALMDGGDGGSGVPGAWFPLPGFRFTAGGRCVSGSLSSAAAALALS
jgi:hypothetical protein